MVATARALFLLIVALTGDSHTSNYDGYVVIDNAATVTVASGGCTTGRYLGHELDGSEYRDYVTMTLSHDPHAVTVMLGTNDAFRAATYPTWLNTYRDDMLEIMDRYVAAGVDLYVLTPPPILGDAPGALPQAAAAAVILETDIVPWIRANVPAQATLIDVFADIQEQPGWESWYDSQGVHLYGQGGIGYRWLAQTVSDAISAGLMPSR